MRTLTKLLLLSLFGLALFYEYDSGGFHRLYIRALLVNHDVVVVLYKADWCPACTQVIPVMKRMHQAGLVELVIVDTDKDDEHKFGTVVFYIPQISVFRADSDGEKGLTYHGSFPPTREELVYTLFSGLEVNPILLNFSIQDLYEEVEQPQLPQLL